VSIKASRAASSKAGRERSRRSRVRGRSELKSRWKKRVVRTPRGGLTGEQGRARCRQTFQDVGEERTVG
jgi:hypothetical protein